jgi:GT2 family glycosyltransferase
MSRLAVVILNWNGRCHLQRYLPSVVAHTSGEAEVIVADNGSTDDSLVWLRAHYPGVRTIELDRNYGYAGGYNRALKQVDSDYLLLLNSDVEVTEGWWQPLVELLDANRDVAAVAPKLLADSHRDSFEYAGAAGGFIDYLGYPFCRGRILQEVEADRGQYDQEREIFWASGAALCCRARLFHALGGFSPHFFAHMEEIDLCWRMQLRGWSLKVVPQSRVWHLGGATLEVDSPRKIYLNHRNNLMMLYRCASPMQRWVVALVRPLTDLAAAMSYLLKGHGAAFGAVVKAWWHFLKAHSRLREERREIRKEIKKEPVGIYCGSIVLRYLLGGRHFNHLM